MKWNSKSENTIIHERKSWHVWFAWWPTRIDEEFYWLENISRRAKKWAWTGLGFRIEYEYSNDLDIKKINISEALTEAHEPKERVASEGRPPPLTPTKRNYYQ